LLEPELRGLWLLPGDRHDRIILPDCGGVHMTNLDIGAAVTTCISLIYECRPSCRIRTERRD